MNTTIRITVAAAAALTLAACGDSTVPPLAPVRGNLTAAVAASPNAELDYVRFDNRHTGIFFAQLPCDVDGTPGEFVRVSGEWHVWGRRPDLPLEHDFQGTMHVSIHGSFEGVAVGQTTGRVFDVTLKEVEVFNGAEYYGLEDGAFNWRARIVFVERETNTRYERTFVNRVVITPNGDVVVDRVEGWPGCN